MQKNKEHKKPKPRTPVSPAPSSAKDNPLFFIGASLLLTFIAYLPALKAGFVNWDDDDYVLKNVMIQSFSNLKQMITVSVQGNYHPLTMMSLAFNYSISGYEPWSYHLLNVILHLLNVFLVYRFAFNLGKSQIIAFATALLFGVHPMHVESVAWVSERKDVLYAFFFLLGMMSYLNYAKQNSMKSYALCFVWFLLSLASKPAAIIFPVALLTVDFFVQRKMSVKLVIEKIPFVLFAVLMAYLTVTAQKTVGATDAVSAYPLANRVLFASYGFMIYFFKLLLPVNQVAFYPFPAVNKSLPVIYYLSPVFFIVVAVVCYLTLKKYRVVAFGFLFYLVNLLLVLQFFIVGSAVISERYTYMPFLGIFFLAGWLLDYWLKRKPTLAYSLIGSVGVILTLCSYKQAETWQSSEALWDNVIQRLPSDRAYVNRATLFKKGENTDLAISYYNEAIKLNSVAHEAYCNRGNIYLNAGKDSLAIADYDRALSIKPDFVAALDDRGAFYSHIGKWDAALSDLNHALQLQPDYKTAYMNRAVVYKNTKQYENAIKDFEKYLQYEPAEAEVYNAIGVCYQYEGKFELSLAPFTKAIELTNSPNYFLNRSYTWNAMRNMEKAREDALKAQSMGYPVDKRYLDGLRR